jgi:heme/copper-type cytochrome/quinol oxidase subunit 2
LSCKIPEISFEAAGHSSATVDAKEIRQGNRNAIIIIIIIIIMIVVIIMLPIIYTVVTIIIVILSSEGHINCNKCCHAESLDVELPGAGESGR